MIPLQDVANKLKAKMTPSSGQRPTQHLWDLYNLCANTINASLLNNEADVSAENVLLKKTSGVSELHLGGSMQFKICSLPNVENAEVQNPFDLSEACKSNYGVLLS